MAAFSSSHAWSLQQQWICVVLLIATLFISVTLGCPYSSIISFGDSIADTGNLYFSGEQPSQHCFYPPYGETYFHHPAGRCSDGRLIIDFFAESLRLPLVKPYWGIKFKDWKITEGVNFAVIGATALEVSFFKERGIPNVPTNNSLRVQLDWFKQILAPLCNSSSSCKSVIGKSLFVVGEIGGNDYNYPLALRKSVAEITTYVPHVINAISSAINELIDVGAQTVVVPGNFPMGCIAVHLTMYESKDKKQYDEGGCLKWLNKFAEYHNDKLKAELNRLRELHPHANIIYADYYNAALKLFHSPTKFGFKGLKICCGSGGPYNYNASAVCGNPGVRACDDPSKFIGWDGIHLTQQAYGWIAKGLLDGRYTFPKFSSSCSPFNVSFGYF